MYSLLKNRYNNYGFYYLLTIKKDFVLRIIDAYPLLKKSYNF